MWRFEKYFELRMPKNDFFTDFGGVLVGDGLIPDSFAIFFQTKVRSFLKQAKVSMNVYNGKKS